MGRKVEVPVTPRVLDWAIRESGYSLDELATQVSGGVSALESWIAGTAHPSLTEARALATKLHRQLATFLLPEPPAVHAGSVQFRQPASESARTLNPVERRFLRRARRLQSAHAWIVPELEGSPVDLPSVDLASASQDAADRFRADLRIGLDEQTAWRSASQAFDVWRDAVEAQGIVVMMFRMGNESVQGFSLWDRTAPLVAINSAWRDEARIFTLFHEVGHLLTRTDSACALPSLSTGSASDAAERWCEEFSAAVTIPLEALAHVGHVSNLKELGRLAARYRISLRAMALRLIKVDKASWVLYRQIPKASEDKASGGPPGSTRTVLDVREDEFGHRGTRVFVDAVRQEVISESQALDYLNIPAQDFEHLLAAPRP